MQNALMSGLIHKTTIPKENKMIKFVFIFVPGLLGAYKVKCLFLAPILSYIEVKHA